MDNEYGRLGKHANLMLPSGVVKPVILYDQGGDIAISCDNPDDLINIYQALVLHGNSYSTISNNSGANREILELRAKSDAFTPGNDGSGVNFYGDGDSVNPGHIIWFVNGYSQFKIIPVGGNNAYAGIGNEHDPRDPFEIYFTDEDPILRITAAGGTAYDPQISFHTGTGADPAKKAGIGVDAGDSDKLKIITGPGALGGSSTFVFNGTKFGIGENTPEKHIHIKSASENPGIIIEGNCKSQFTNSISTGREILEIRAKENLSNGAGINIYGDSDSSSPDEVKIFTNGTAQITIKNDGSIIFTNVKSGATQAAAGAVAGEPWYTSGHATLIDNVMMMGV